MAIFDEMYSYMDLSVCTLYIPQFRPSTRKKIGSGPVKIKMWHRGVVGNTEEGGNSRDVMGVSRHMISVHGLAKFEPPIFD